MNDPMRRISKGMLRFSGTNRETFEKWLRHRSKIFSANQIILIDIRQVLYYELSYSWIYLLVMINH
jgi:hypothetical protein